MSGTGFPEPRTRHWPPTDVGGRHDRPVFGSGGPDPYPGPGSGQHAARRRDRWALIRRPAVLIPVIVVLLVGGMAVIAAQAGPMIGNRVVVDALAVADGPLVAGRSVSATARLVAERRRTFNALVVIVRDAAGGNHDFPAASNWTVDRVPREVTASRVFEAPGTYTYWIALRDGGRWMHLRPQRTFAVVRDPAAGATATPSVGPSASPSASGSAIPGGPPGVPPAVPPPGKGFPNSANTGVPSGTALSPYTGSCTITVNNTVISAKTVDCDLSIRAAGVIIRNSRINGFVSTSEGSRASFRLEDSNVNASPGGARLVTGVGADNFTVLRSEIVGGNRGIYCRRNCEVRDSWIHGTKITGDWHASGIRASQGSRIIHNTISCDTQPTPQDGGCSADLTMYGDFEAVRDVWVERNLFVPATILGFCTYGGSTPGKPFSSGAGNITFLSNTFARGTNRKCGAYGPVIAFDTSRPGNRWAGNVWDDGAPVPPSN